MSPPRIVVRHQPACKFGEASIWLVTFSPVACVRVAPCVCVAVADASWCPVELFGFGQLRGRARAISRALGLAICVQPAADDSAVFQRLLGTMLDGV